MSATCSPIAEWSKIHSSAIAMKACCGADRVQAEHDMGVQILPFLICTHSIDRLDIAEISQELFDDKWL